MSMWLLYAAYAVGSLIVGIIAAIPIEDFANRKGKPYLAGLLGGAVIAIIATGIAHGAERWLKVDLDLCWLGSLLLAYTAMFVTLWRKWIILWIWDMSR